MSNKLYKKSHKQDIFDIDTGNDDQFNDIIIEKGLNRKIGLQPGKRQLNKPKSKPKVNYARFIDNNMDSNVGTCALQQSFGGFSFDNSPDEKKKPRYPSGSQNKCSKKGVTRRWPSSGESAESTNSVKPELPLQTRGKITPLSRPTSSKQIPSKQTATTYKKSPSAMSYGRATTSQQSRLPKPSNNSNIQKQPTNYSTKKKPQTNKCFLGGKSSADALTISSDESDDEPSSLNSHSSTLITNGKMFVGSDDIGNCLIYWPKKTVTNSTNSLKKNNDNNNNENRHITIEKKKNKNKFLIEMNEITMICFRDKVKMNNYGNKNSNNVSCIMFQTKMNGPYYKSMDNGECYNPDDDDVILILFEKNNFSSSLLDINALFQEFQQYYLKNDQPHHQPQQQQQPYSQQTSMINIIDDSDHENERLTQALKEIDHPDYFNNSSSSSSPRQISPRARRSQRLSSSAKSQVNQHKVILQYPPEKSAQDPVLITVGDKKRLDPYEYLNDNLVDFYLKYMLIEKQTIPLQKHQKTNKKHEEEEEEEDEKNIIKNDSFSKEQLCQVHIFSSHFYVQLNSFQGTKVSKRDDGINFANVARWTKDFDLFSKRFVFVPVVEYSHWSVAVVCNLDCILEFYLQHIKKEQSVKIEPSEEKEEEEEEGGGGGEGTYDTNDDDSGMIEIKVDNRQDFEPKSESMLDKTPESMEMIGDIDLQRNDSVIVLEEPTDESEQQSKKTKISKCQDDNDADNDEEFVKIVNKKSKKKRGVCAIPSDDDDDDIILMSNKRKRNRKVGEQSLPSLSPSSNSHKELVSINDSDDDDEVMPTQTSIDNNEKSEVIAPDIINDVGVDDEVEDVVNNRVPCIVFMDSLRMHSSSTVATQIRLYLKMEWEKKKQNLFLKQQEEKIRKEKDDDKDEEGGKDKHISSTTSSSSSISTTLDEYQFQDEEEFNLFDDFVMNCLFSNHKGRNHFDGHYQLPLIEPKVPRQPNGFDCGVYALQYCEEVLCHWPQITYENVNRRTVDHFTPHMFSHKHIEAKREGIGKIINQKIAKK